MHPRSLFVPACIRIHSTQRRPKAKHSGLSLYFFTYEANSVPNIMYQHPLGKSDHCCLQFEYVVKDRIVTEFDSQKLNYWKGDFTSMRKALDEIDWSIMLAAKTVEEMWAYFKDTLQTLCSSYVPYHVEVRIATKRRKLG